METATERKLDPNEELTFDVVSLFTSIPTNIEVEVANNRLSADVQLSECTALIPTDICTLLSFCLNSTEIQCQGK